MKQAWCSACFVGLWCVLSACSAYDARLIQADDVGGSGGTGGSGGSTGGTGGNDVCGDGQVTGLEKCDTAIDGSSAVDAGLTAGACPTRCGNFDPCSPSVLRGAGCQAECVFTSSCVSGDAKCCASSCDEGFQDDDCSTCGNGELDLGETCDPAAIDAACPEPLDCVDENACSTDALVGSANDCNAMCVHENITQAIDGDMCCPIGQTAATDADCVATCGNDIVETGEECDGSANCVDCKIMATEAQRQCLDRLTVSGSVSPECERCACMRCADQTNACREPANPAHKQNCNAVIDCALTNDCAGEPCYCGTAFGCFGPNGSCKAQIEAAGETTDQFTVFQRTADPNFALKYAWDLSVCAQDMCPEVCPPSM